MQVEAGRALRYRLLCSSHSQIDLMSMQIQSTRRSRGSLLVLHNLRPRITIGGRNWTAW
jgi:hypothetical protein